MAIAIGGVEVHREPLSADTEGPVTEITLRSGAPVVRRHAVLVSSLEDADDGTTPQQQHLAADLNIH